MSSKHLPVARPSRATIEGFALATAILLSAPQLSVGQTVKPTDLAGKWAREGSRFPYLTFSDTAVVIGGNTMRWQLAGDTILIGAALSGGGEALVGLRRLVKIDGERLSLTEPGKKVSRFYMRTTKTRLEWDRNQPITGRAIPCEDGVLKSFECQNIELLSFVPKDSLGSSVGTDLWGWHDSTTKREFAIMGGESTAFVDVTDPLNPKYLGFLPPHGAVSPKAHAAQSVKVYKNYAFIGYEGVDHGIQIFDLTQLRNVKSPTTFKETAHYAGLTNTHTIAVNPATGFLYVNGSNTCGGGLHMLDLHDPLKPVHVGCYSEPNTGRAGTGYVHDTQCVIYRGPDKQYTGREICINYAETGVSIADVTDKKAPKTISIATYPSVGYTHQGWFTEDQRYIYLNDELDEGTVGQTRTIGFDLSDLDQPVLLTEFMNVTTDTDHNLYIRGRYMYQGNYGAGLRIIDVNNPKNPKEVGYLTEIGSAWGTYPFFKNDVVAVPVSSGLFLVRLLQRKQPQ